MDGYKLEYRHEVDGDMKAIYNYIAIEKSNPEGAQNTIRKIKRLIDELKSAPIRGRVLGVDRNTNLDIRQVSTKNYSVLFEVDESNLVVDIVLVTYGRRNLPKLLRRRLGG